MSWIDAVDTLYRTFLFSIPTLSLYRDPHRFHGWLLLSVLHAFYLAKLEASALDASTRVG